MEKSQKDINQLKKTFTSFFEMADLRPIIHYFVLLIIKDITTGIIFLFQETYIQKILKYFDMQNSRGVITSMAKKDILVNADVSY